MSFEQIFFLLFAALIVGGAISVLVQRSPLYSAFSLILAFIGLACMYILLGAQFLGVVQIVVYAGAIMVLFVFVIMLLNIRREENLQDRHKSLYFLAFPLGLALIAEVIYVVRKVDIQKTMGDVGTVQSIGKGLLTDYLLPFEATSILLLMAIIGSMHLAKREKE